MSPKQQKGGGDMKCEDCDGTGLNGHGEYTCCRCDGSGEMCDVCGEAMSLVGECEFCMEADE